MIFIDTGPFLARYLQHDQHHARAVEGWKELDRRRLRCLTSNFVLDELLTLLARRAGPAFAAETGRRILGSHVLEIVRPGEKEETEAVGLLEKLADQGVSFTDCVSFALMRKAKARQAFTFDRHFSAAGFELWPA
ncbi:MAG: PIN domain-containing protein [Elusimicrobia bacterium]|nr:PIN domain-containing protein [Elusimicrobiota bacterium]